MCRLLSTWVLQCSLLTRTVWKNDCKNRQTNRVSKKQKSSPISLRDQSSLQDKSSSVASYRKKPKSYLYTKVNQYLYNMDTDLLFGSGLSLFAHQCLRGCLHQIRRFINASYLLTLYSPGCSPWCLTPFCHWILILVNCFAYVAPQSAIVKGRVSAI